MENLRPDQPDGIGGFGDFFDQADLPIARLPMISPLPEMEYIVLRETPAVRIKFNVINKDVVTMFGGKSGESLELDRSQIERLPHNLVLTCFENPTPESEVAGMTPDISRVDEDGNLSIIEIGTARTMTMGSVRDLVRRKVAKYADLIEGGYASRINAVAVNRMHAHSREGPLPLHDKDCLIEAYMRGLEILNAFEQIHGVAADPEMDERREALKDVLLTKVKKASMDWQVSSDGIVPADSMLRICRVGYEKDVESWDSAFRRWSQGSTEQRTVCHLPMICPEEWDINLLSELNLEAENGYNAIIKMIMPSHLEKKESDFEELEDWSTVMGGDTGTSWRKKRQTDTIRVHLTRLERLNLAMRGVMKKELDREDAMIAKQMEDKLAQSILTPTDDISAYLSEEPEWVDTPVFDYSELDGRYVKDGTMDLRGFYNDVSKLKDMHELKVLDEIVRELAYNINRNPDDKASKKEFIIRALPSYDVVVIIRTTRLGGEDSPIFFFLVYKGKSHQGHIFEDAIPIGKGLYRTSFMSLNKRKIEALCGVVGTAMSLMGMLLEQFEDLSDEVDRMAVSRVYPAFRNCLLILLQDKDSTSRNLQQLRYYYMQLLSGSRDCLTNSLKVLSKFDDIFRNRLIVFYMQRLRAIHESLPEDIFRRGFLESRLKKELDEEAEEESKRSGESIPDVEQHVFTDPIDTPFGFSIRGPDDVLLASYMSVLHNKNEGNYGHGVMQILDKICEAQLRAKELIRMSSLTPEEYHVVRGQNVDPDSMKEFQHSESAVAFGVKLAIKKMIKHSGMTASQFNGRMEREIMGFLLRTTYDELATTKATTVPFDTDLVVSVDGDEVKELGKRIKCIEAMHRIVTDATDQSVCMDLGDFVDGIIEDEGGCIQVTIFKKNQIGGTREIFVLTMRGRVLIRAYSDVYRWLCLQHPSETLTDDSSKDNFVARHYSELRESLPSGSSYSTLKVSGDMTRWSQSFSMYEFNTVAKVILPESLKRLSDVVLSLHRNKIVQIPRQAVEMFLANAQSDLSSAGTDSLKEAFLGLEDNGLCDPGSPYIKASVDFLQGILHYPSSFYHVCHLEYLCETIRSWARQGGVEAKVSFEVSSDDEGLLISLYGESKKVDEMTRKLYGLYSRLKRTVDLLFGLKSSFEKTTITLMEIFEFNSKFYIGNTIVSPLIKFVSRAQDDNPAESLQKRVSALYAQLFSLRANGASGALCSWVSMSQAITYYSNLGVGMMSWYRKGLLEEMFPVKISAVGAYMIMPPSIAGLTDAVYVDWLAARNDPKALNCVFYLSSYGLPRDQDELDSAMFGVFPKRKYRDMLKRMGLEFVQRADLVTEENFLGYLRAPRNATEAKMHIERKALDPSIAVSMSFINRMDAMRMTPYLLWTAMFKESGSRVTLRELVDRISSRPVKTTRESLFPMWRQFLFLDQARDQRLYRMPLSRKRRLRYQWITPFYLFGDHQAEVKDVLIETWYGLRSKNHTVGRIKKLWTEIKVDLPFLREEGPNESLVDSPFESLDQLLSYIESYAKVNRNMKILARGVMDSGGSSHDKLIRYNVSPHHFFARADSDEPTEGEATMMPVIATDSAPVLDPRLSSVMSLVEDRLKAWYELLFRLSDQYEEEALREMHRDIKEYTNDLFRARGLRAEHAVISSTGSKRLDSLKSRIMLMSGMIDLESCWDHSDQISVWNQVEVLENGRYSGDFDVFRKKGDVVVRLTKLGSVVLAKSRRSEKLVKETLRNYIIDQLEFSDIKIPTGTVSDIRNVGGTRMLCVRCEDGVERFVSLPNAHMRIVYPHENRNRPWPSHIESWLCRKPIDDDAFEDLLSTLRETTIWGALTRSMVVSAGALRKQKVFMKLQERVAAAVPRVEVTQADIDELLAFAEDLAPTEELKPSDLAEGWLSEMGIELDLERMGLEAFSLESSFAAYEINKSISSLVNRVSPLTGIRPRHLGDDIKYIITLFTEVAED